jgi:hypothetical protein
VLSTGRRRGGARAGRRRWRDSHSAYEPLAVAAVLAESERSRPPKCRSQSDEDVPGRAPGGVPRSSPVQRAAPVKVASRNSADGGLLCGCRRPRCRGGPTSGGRHGTRRSRQPQTGYHARATAPAGAASSSAVDWWVLRLRRNRGQPRFHWRTVPGHPRLRPTSPSRSSRTSPARRRAGSPTRNSTSCAGRSPASHSSASVRHDGAERRPM